MKTRSLGLIALLVLLVGMIVSLLVAPRETLTVLAPVAVCAGAVAYVANTSRQSRPGALVAAINTLPANIGSSKHSRRYLATAAIAVPAPCPASNARYALVKKGADDEHAAIVAAASDEPIGAATDEAAAAEDPINVELFGINAKTLPLVAKAAIGLGADVYSDGTGKVTVKPTAAGTYWRVGKAMTAAGADGDPIEVMPIRPRKLIVVAALTQTSNATIAGLNSTAVNPTKADFDALLAEAGKLQHDFYVLSGALSGDADVTVATT
jgi:hypothetical protein